MLVLLLREKRAEAEPPPVAPVASQEGYEG
jgi:hypothetical protein